MDNCFDMQCPKCGESDRIDVYTRIWVRLTKDGTDADASEDGTHEWDDADRADCIACGHSGKVFTFRVENQEERGHRNNPDYCAKCNGVCQFDSDGNPKPQDSKAIEVLKEFIRDVEAVGYEETCKDWPDLSLTYNKAKALGL